MREAAKAWLSNLTVGRIACFSTEQAQSRHGFVRQERATFSLLYLKTSVMSE
jgi:hypothetical protein